MDWQHGIHSYLSCQILVHPLSYDTNCVNVNNTGINEYVRFEVNDVTGGLCTEVIHLIPVKYDAKEQRKI